MLFLKNSRKKMAALVASVAILLGGSQGATASSATTTFQVTASVVSSCTISATNLVFGNYTLAQLDGTSTVTVTCTNGSAFKIGLNAGTGTGATVLARKMTSGANTLNYALYQDTSRATNWGNTPGTDTVNGTGNGSAQSYTVYGRIAANQSSAIGAYTDTITATVNF